METQEKGDLTRREFGKNAAIAATTLLLGYSVYRTIAWKDPPDYFDGKIPGAWKVYRHMAENDRHVLVHIAQLHAEPELNDARFEKMREKIQGNIYKILSDMIQNAGLRHVYDEGLTGEMLAAYMESAAIVRLFNNYLQNAKKENLDSLVRLRISNLAKSFEGGRINPRMGKAVENLLDMESYGNQLRSEMEFLKGTQSSEELVKHFTNRDPRGTTRRAR